MAQARFECHYIESKELGKLEGAHLRFGVGRVVRAVEIGTQLECAVIEMIAWCCLENEGMEVVLPGIVAI